MRSSIAEALRICTSSWRKAFGVRPYSSAWNGWTISPCITWQSSGSVRGSSRTRAPWAERSVKGPDIA